jgi:hypothetical protein
MPVRPPRSTCLALAVLLTALWAREAGAQATRDQSRLVLGVSVGYIGGTDLWSVAEQPILTNTEATDVFRLKRSLRANVTFVGQATWYSSANLGFTGELAYIGLGTRDGCGLVAASGNPLNRLVCRTLDGNERPASAVSLGVGATFRPASRAFLQPYARAVTGIALAPRSTVRTVATIGQFGDTAFTIYPGNNGTDTKLTGTVAAGFATSASPGYQFRIELRNTWVQLPIVTGAAAFQGEIPPTSTVWKSLPSLLIGFDIVLEKRRGRRY